MKKIALTGSSGVVGSQIREYFSNAEIIAFQGDIRDETLVKTFCKDNKNCDAFIHLAALVPTKSVNDNPSKAFDVNVKGTLNILEGLKDLKNPPWLFYASSSHVYDSSDEIINEDFQLNPITFYGMTKLQGEFLCKQYSREFNLNICIGRIFSFSDVLQDKLFFIPATVQKIINAPVNGELSFFGVKGKRDFLTVTQICQIIGFLYNKKFNGIINIASGVGVNLFDIVYKIVELVDRFDLNIIIEDDKPTYQVADITKLKSLGINIDTKINQLLEQMVNKELEK